MRKRLRIVQQCRPEDLDAVREAYADCEADAELAAFFADIPERLAWAHLVIARAGASTVAELTTAGRPAILVPYPFAMDDHQTANARAVSGAAWVMTQRELTVSTLTDRLAAILTDPAQLGAAAAASANLGGPDAARLLADLVEAELTAQGVGAGALPLRGVAA
jgi:UDP-N-acetylglucosamine--N-acetylmuramyl-(pentapeptide) pyrophosphoryl-undecaprenol N-acetylglucosamine transferase